MTRFDGPRLEAIIALVLATDLPLRRETLVAALPIGVSAALTSTKSPADQTRRDLRALNRWAVESGPHPLDIWLDAACATLAEEGRAEAKRLRALAGGGRLPGSAPSLWPSRRRGPWAFAAALVVAGGLAAWGWSGLPPGWNPAPSLGPAPGPSDLMRQGADGWRRVAGPCVAAKWIRAAAGGRRRSVSKAALAEARWTAACDAALDAAARAGEALWVVLAVQGPADAPEQAEGWYGRPVEIEVELREALR